MSTEKQASPSTDKTSCPADTRFKKGNRANPYGRKGKPQKVEPFNPNAVVAAHYAEPVETRRNGKPYHPSSLEAALSVLRAKALKGDLQALNLYFRVAMKMDLSGISAALARAEEEKDEQAIQNALRQMLLAFEVPGSSSGHH